MSNQLHFYRPACHIPQSPAKCSNVFAFQTGGVDSCWTFDSGCEKDVRRGPTVKDGKQRQEEEQRRREDAERARQLQEKLDRWRLARDAREYVREARALAAAASRTIEEGSSLDKSLKWAESYAERV